MVSELEEIGAEWDNDEACWRVADYEGVKAALRDVSSYKNSGTEVGILRHLASHKAALEPLAHHFSHGVLHSDPPEHRRLRKPLSSMFTTKAIADRRADIVAICGELIDAVGGEPIIDVVESFAYPLPARVVTRMLGVEQQSYTEFISWTDAVVSFLGNLESGDSAKSAAQALTEAGGWLRERLTGMTFAKDSILAALSSELKKGSIDDNEVLSTCVTLVLAGHETTASLIASMFMEVSSNPSLQHRLRASSETEVLARTLVEEVLRFHSPVRTVRRTIPAKPENPLLLEIDRANRDGSVFSDPEEFDPSRTQNRHLAFGHGIHLCLGAPLARLEAEVALLAFLDATQWFGVRDQESYRWIENDNLQRLTVLRLRVDW